MSMHFIHFTAHAQPPKFRIRPKDMSHTIHDHTTPLIAVDGGEDVAVIHITGILFVHVICQKVYL